MSEILFQYKKVDPTSWAYLSSLLMVALFFKFNRFWSVRNLDLLLLIWLAPGLLMVNSGLRRVHQLEREEAVAVATPQATTASTATPSSDSAPAVEASPASSEGDAARPATEAATTTPPPTATAQATPTDKEAGNKGDAPAGSPLATAADLESNLAKTKIPTSALHSELVRFREISLFGFLWLFIGLVFLLIRLLFDPTMTRRPLLEPNLSPGGLLFLGFWLFAFHVANILHGDVTADERQGAKSAAAMVSSSASDLAKSRPDNLQRFGPGYYFLHMLPSIPTSISLPANDMAEQERAFVVVAKTMAILSNLGIVIGLILIGYWHFENIRMGIGTATLYLMLPYTAQLTGCVEHALPAALLIWAVVLYRRPMLAGLFIGLAMGTVYYPFFLLPLWVSFYWQRGVMRFVGGVGLSLVAMALSLLAGASENTTFWELLQSMFGLWLPRREGLQGVWNLGWDPIFRLPVLAAFVALTSSMAIWPAQKNLGTLLSCSAAIMVAAQFWHGNDGGLFMAWFLPLTLLAMFRPNLEDRVALSVLGEGWFSRRRARLFPMNRAA